MEKKKLTNTLMSLSIMGSFCFVSNSALSQPVKVPLEIEITGIRNTKGLIVVQLYDTPSGWNSSRPSETVSIPIIGGKSTTTFSVNPSNSYAIHAFHDENTNNRLDENILKIPKEGVGLSNNPKLDHNPKFDEIAVRPGNSPVQVALKYF